MSLRPVRTFPFDLITLNHFAHIFNFFSSLFNLLYVTCVMVNKAVKKKFTWSALFLGCYPLVHSFPMGTCQPATNKYLFVPV